MTILIFRNRLDPEAETMGHAANTQSVLNAVTEKPDSMPEGKFAE